MLFELWSKIASFFLEVGWYLLIAIVIIIFLLLAALTIRFDAWKEKKKQKLKEKLRNKFSRSA